jgi:hypothetical protein
MTLQSEPYKDYREGDRMSARDLRAVRRDLAKLARSSQKQGITDSTGNISGHRRQFDLKEKSWLWKVVSAGSQGVAEDSIYTCAHQVIDNWSTTDGSAKYTNRFSYTQWLTATAYTRESYVENDGEIYWCVFSHLSNPVTEPGTGAVWTTYWRRTQGQVINILENDPQATYSSALAKGDLMIASPARVSDGSVKWMGFSVSGGNVRLAQTTEDAPGDDNIACNLLDMSGTEITSGLGSGIDVYCKIAGGSALNAAIPRLSDNDQIPVFHANGVWYCSQVFQTTEDCDCIGEQVTSYNVTNEQVDRAFDADNTSEAEIADVLGTLINDLIAAGVIT